MDQMTIEPEVVSGSTEEKHEVSVVEEKSEVTEIRNMETPHHVGGMVQAFREYYALGNTLAKSSLVPQTYQNNPGNCAIALDIADRMGVSPMFVMQNLYVVKGTPSWSGQGCMSIIRACGRYKGVEPVYTGDIGKDNRACHIEAIDKASGEKVIGTEINWQMIKAEGWDKNSKWKSMTEQMMAYRAATFFARIYCPNELMGFKVEGESEDIHPNVSKAVDVMGDVVDAEVVDGTVGK